MAKAATKPVWNDDLTSDNKAKEWADYHAAKGDAAKPVKKEFKIIDNAYHASAKPEDDTTKDSYLYPFADLNVGQGLFIPLESNNTIDKLMTAIHRQVDLFRNQYSEIERNEEGDQIYENVTIRARKRKPDGSFELDGEGVPKLTASSVLRPKLIGPMFRIRAIKKDDEFAKGTKSDSDGVLVIRLD
jgi:hypothetical protein